MNRATAVIFLWAALAVTRAEAQQVCTPAIPPNTPTEDFTDHGDGTLTHKPTGLMWKRCLEGLSGSDCATGTASTNNWQQALQLAEGSSFAGYSDWRLPNLKELNSIVERRCYAPAINLNAFPNDSSSFVWSGSPLVGGNPQAWLVDFEHGGVHFYGRSSSLWVRLVRGGQ